MPYPYNDEKRPWVPVESIPLSESVLCVDCGMVTRAKNGHCPVCESASIINLARILDRTGVAVQE